MAIYPPVALALLCVNFIVGWGKFRRSGLWNLREAGIWDVALFSLLLLGLAHSFSRSGLQLVWFALALMLIGRAGRILPLRPWFMGIVLGLLCTAVLGTVQREASRELWSEASTVGVGYGTVQRESILDGETGGWVRNGARLIEKTWQIQPRESPLELRLELKRLAGTFGWQWLTHSRETRQKLISAGPEEFVRMQIPTGKMVRRGRTPADITPEAIRITMKVRGAADYESGDCGLSLRTFEPNRSVCASFQLSQAWQNISLELSFPADSTHGGFNVEFESLDLEWFDIRDFHAEYKWQNEWHTLETMEPASIHLFVPMVGVHRFRTPAIDAVPRHTWQTYTLAIPVVQQPESGRLTVRLQQPPGVSVALRNAVLRSVDTGAAAKAIPTIRSAYLLGDSNLSGHMFTMLGLVAIMLAPNLLSSSIIFVVAVTSVLTTGSRTAWAVLLVAGFILLWLAAEKRWKWILAFVAVGGAMLGAFLFDAGAVLGRLNLETFTAANSVTRPEIWRAAMQLMQEYPITGIGDAFAEHWMRLKSVQSGIMPLHAHNFWLQQAAEFGIPGLMGAVFFSVGLVAMAWQKRKIAGLILVSAVFVLNFMDYTLTFSGVYVPLIVGLAFSANR